MSDLWCLSWPRKNAWQDFPLQGLDIKVKAPKIPERYDPASIPPFFWNKGARRRLSTRLGGGHTRLPTHDGYREARGLIGAGSVAELDSLSLRARQLVTAIFEDVMTERSGSEEEDTDSGPAKAKAEMSLSSNEPSVRVVRLRLSPELEAWKTGQHAAGNILPPKGAGLTKASDKTLRLFGAQDWPEALQTTNALFGCGIASLLMGAADSSTMFSNYVTDMAFYYEHGYNYVFPTLDRLYERGLCDAKALRTPGGRERREAVRIGMRYIKGKIALERQHKAHLTNLSARLGRRQAQIISLSESSLLGMAAEAIARGFDAGAVMSDLVFSSPGTDVVDVGCDIVNSEVMNSFLNVADITSTGVVSEEVLRKIYDAYAATGARMLVQRWHEPVARMCAALYTWHIQNDRHMFFRRALLGWPMARKTPASPQVEADFDEVFDEEYFTTGFARPLDPEFACDGRDTCNHVEEHLHRNRDSLVLRELWEFLVTAPLEYVRAGKVDDVREQQLIEGSRLRMAQLFSQGLVVEMVWLIAHANHHAWQVNYLFEAAMFGSLLDAGTLAGKLDRQEE